MERLKFHRRESWGKILNSQNLYDWGCFWTATTWQKGGSTQGVYPMYLPILLLFTHPILLAAITVRTSTGGLLVCSMAATFLLFKQFPIQTAKTASIASSFSRSDLRAQIGEKIHLGKEHTPLSTALPQWIDPSWLKCFHMRAESKPPSLRTLHRNGKIQCYHLCNLIWLWDFRLEDTKSCSRVADTAIIFST